MYILNLDKHNVCAQKVPLVTCHRRGLPWYLQLGGSVAQIQKVLENERTNCGRILM